MQEKEIMDAIENAGKKGINVRGMVSAGLSPATLKKYLTILENEKGLIIHEKVKNSDVYVIRHGSQVPYNISHEFVMKTLDEFDELLNQVFENTSKWGLAEKIEVYQNIVNFTVLMKYQIKLVLDIVNREDPRIPEDVEIISKRLDSMTTRINQSLDLSFVPFIMIQLQNSMGESIEYLESISNKTKRRGKKAKYVRPIVDEIKSNPEKLKEIETEFKELMNLD